MESAEIEQRRREDVKSFNRKELKNSKKRRGEQGGPVEEGEPIIDRCPN